MTAQKPNKPWAHHRPGYFNVPPDAPFIDDRNGETNYVGLALPADMVSSLESYAIKTLGRTQAVGLFDEIISEWFEERARATESLYWRVRKLVNAWRADSGYLADEGIGAVGEVAKVIAMCHQAHALELEQAILATVGRVPEGTCTTSDAAPTRTQPVGSEGPSGDPRAASSRK